MKKFSFILASALLLAMTCMLRADNNAHEIQLTEIENMSSGFMGGGDDPLDDPETGEGQGNPNSCYAIINGHVLSVGAPSGPLQSRLYVYNANGQNVVDRFFRRTAIVNIINNGYYTLQIKTGNHTFQGEFEVTY